MRNIKNDMNSMVMISFPIEELQTVIIDCVNACLKHHKPALTQTPQPETDQFFNLQEAASFLKIREIDVYGMVNRKELSRRLYFSKSELIEVLKQGGGRIRIGAQKKKVN